MTLYLCCLYTSTKLLNPPPPHTQTHTFSLSSIKKPLSVYISVTHPFLTFRLLSITLNFTSLNIPLINILNIYGDMTHTPVSIRNHSVNLQLSNTYALLSLYKFFFLNELFTQYTVTPYINFPY